MARPKAEGYLVFVSSDVNISGIPGYKGGNNYKVLKEDIFNRLMATGKARFLGYGNKYGNQPITETPRIKVQL